ncbi:MAG: hypothetical protein LBS52_07005 [Dysgonamonadaceae bacterium]|jgi:hypothetical protein|nr:hypothetical protein [Dysgonamonadaceae bacterium]
MFQLYKKRDFSSYIGDTIAFFRGYWKNFLGNYITITGGMIFVICVLYFFIFRDLFGSLFNTRSGGVGYDIGYYFTENTGLFFALIVISLIVGFSLSLFSMAYPVAYMQLMENSEKTKFSVSEIFDQMKRYLPKLIRFALLSLVVLLPLVILAVVLSSVLIIVIVGVFLLLLLIPISVVLYYQMLFLYLHDDLGFFESLRAAWKMLFSKKFWHIIGSTTVMYFIISTIQSGITMIPYIIILVSLVLSANDGLNNISPIVSGLYIVAIALSFIFNNALLINQGLIFYSFKEQSEHTQAFSEIDLIGQNAE